MIITEDNEPLQKRGHFTQINNTVLNDSRISDADKILYLKLKSIGWRGPLQMSQEKLVQLSGWSRRKLNTSLDNLHRAGLITREPQRYMVPTVYVIHDDIDFERNADTSFNKRSAQKRQARLAASQDSRDAAYVHPSAHTDVHSGEQQLEHAHADSNRYVQSDAHVYVHPSAHVYVHPGAHLIKDKKMLKIPADTKPIALPDRQDTSSFSLETKKSEAEGKAIRLSNRQDSSSYLKNERFEAEGEALILSEQGNESFLIVENERHEAQDVSVHHSIRSKPNNNCQPTDVIVCSRKRANGPNPPLTPHKQAIVKIIERSRRYRDMLMVRLEDGSDWTTSRLELEEYYPELVAEYDAQEEQNEREREGIRQAFRDGGEPSKSLSEMTDAEALEYLRQTSIRDRGSLMALA